MTYKEGEGMAKKGLPVQGARSLVKAWDSANADMIAAKKKAAKKAPKKGK